MEFLFFGSKDVGRVGPTTGGNASSYFKGMRCFIGDVLLTSPYHIYLWEMLKLYIDMLYIFTMNYTS